MGSSYIILRTPFFKYMVFQLYKQGSFMYSSEEQWRTRRCSLSWSVSDGRALSSRMVFEIARAGGLESAGKRHSPPPPREAVRDR